MILLADLGEGAVDRQPRDVHPGVDAAERGDGPGSDLLHLRPHADIGPHGDGLPALADDVVGDPVEGGTATGGQDHPRPPGGGHPGRGEADPAGGARDDDRLVGEGFVLHGVSGFRPGGEAPRPFAISREPPKFPPRGFRAPAWVRRNRDPTAPAGDDPGIGAG